MGAGEKFGASLACIADLDGDGGDDLAVGAPGADDGVGVVFVFGISPTGEWLGGGVPMNALWPGSDNVVLSGLPDSCKGFGTALASGGIVGCSVHK